MLKLILLNKNKYLKNHYKVLKNLYLIFLVCDVHLECPSAIVTNYEMPCIINAETNGEYYSIKLDYGDSQKVYLSIMDGTYYLNKTYIVPLKYNINIQIRNFSLSKNYSLTGNNFFNGLIKYKI